MGNQFLKLARRFEKKIDFGVQRQHLILEFGAAVLPDSLAEQFWISSHQCCLSTYWSTARTLGKHQNPGFASDMKTRARPRKMGRFRKFRFPAGSSGGEKTGLAQKKKLPGSEITFRTIQSERLYECVTYFKKERGVWGERKWRKKPPSPPLKP